MTDLYGGEMPEYIEIEQPREIRQMNSTLAKILRQELSFRERRTIGYPQGSFTADVFFKRKKGNDIFWWSPGENKGHNFFGHASPRESRSLNIEVQFNLPLPQFSRRVGGAFLSRVSDGSIILAHRGHVTLGHARIKRDDLFDEMSATIRTADTSSGPKGFLLIGELEDSNLVDDIEEFASELRRTVRSIKNNKRSSGARPLGGALSSKFSSTRSYFDEFWGKRRIGGRGPAVADCDHGRVVRALRDWLVPRCEEVQKSREIDLMARLDAADILFEVKTSILPQPVYTAVGQLSVHGQVLSDRAKRKVKQVLVLPGEPNRDLQNALSAGLGISLVSYTLSKKKQVNFKGLEVLLSK